MPDIDLIKKSSYFTDEFPFAIQRLINSADTWNTTHRYQREFWKITLLVRGGGSLILDEKRYPIRTDTLMLIHPRSLTTYDITTGELDLYNILFDPVLLARELPSIQDSFHFFSIFSDAFAQAAKAPLYLFDATPAVVGLIRSMEQEFDRKPANHQLVIKLRLLDLLIQLLREAERKIRHTSPEQVVRYIQHLLSLRFRTRIRLDRLAEQTGFSRFHLCRLFKEHTGKTIISALNDLRMDHAADLLKTSTMTVSEISYDAGYNDLSYFFRCFEKRFKLRPRQYRDRHRSGTATDNP